MRQVLMTLAKTVMTSVSTVMAMAMANATAMSIAAAPLTVSIGAVAVATCLGAGQAAAADAAVGAVPNAGLALRAKPKYPPEFKHFDYVNPAAPSGGTLIIGNERSADTQNPYSIKGDPSIEIQQLVFQELGEPALDEPFSRYPGLAESFTLAPDGLSLTVRLRPDAFFSDHQQVLADDVLFSFATFRSAKVSPFYKSYWSDIKELVKVDPHTVKFVFAKENPELALIATQLPVLPKHVYESGDFSTQAIGSGPYTLSEFKPGSSLKLERRRDWWGQNVAVFKGRYNFATVIVKSFKDPTASVEAFKKGDYDFMAVNLAKVWTADLTGDKFAPLHYIRKELLPNSNAQGGQGFVFNLRHPVFQDVRVREALSLAFDFVWSNKNLFSGQYTATESFFQNTPLAAKGMPTPEELAILTPLAANLPPEVFTKPMGWIETEVKGPDRLRQAVALLKAAGYEIKDGVATGPGGALQFRFLLSPGGLQRVIEPYMQNLKKLGVLVSIEEKEESLFLKRLDSREFDMTIAAYRESQSPGNEQRNFWSSATADEPYSWNYAGLKSKGVDALVDRVIYAKSRAELELMTRCLDRALYHSHLMVQNWHLPSWRLAYWDKFGHPDQPPLYYTPALYEQTMWFDPARAAKLSAAQASGAALP